MSQSAASLRGPWTRAVCWTLPLTPHIALAMPSFARLIVLVALLLGACGSAPEPVGPVVLAASSMQEAVTEAAEACTQEGHAPPVLSFAASSAIARQVEGGAPADLVITADAEWMDWLEERALIDPASRRAIAGNMLVLVCRCEVDPQQEAANLDQLLSAPNIRLAIAEPQSVPAGRYAKAALEGMGWWDGEAGRIVPAENVRAALALVERGEAEYGIVYNSDFWAASDEIGLLATIDPALHPQISYPAAIMANSAHPEAQAFLDFLSSARGQGILDAHGFIPAP